MSHPAGPVRSFGPFRYDPEQRLLFRAGAIVPLVPKAIDTLHVLLERHGRVVAVPAATPATPPLLDGRLAWVKW
jgi:DNA-binding response OmpR family regulator